MAFIISFCALASVINGAIKGLVEDGEISPFGSEGPNVSFTGIIIPCSSVSREVSFVDIECRGSVNASSPINKVTIHLEKSKPEGINPNSLTAAMMLSNWNLLNVVIPPLISALRSAPT